MLITAKSENGIAFTNLMENKPVCSGQTVTFTSSPKNCTAGFLGWFNEKNEKVSNSLCFTTKVFGEGACLTAKYTRGTVPKDIGTPAEITKALQQDAYYLPFFQKTVLNTGNQALLAKVVQKALSGQPITIVGLGGSITMGAGTSWADPSGRFLNQVCTTLEKKWHAKVKMVNAGIGATTSLLGKSRMQEHVLKYNPDLVIVDFTTNDQGGEARYAYSYEALIRTLAEKKIATLAILFGHIHNATYKADGICIKDGNSQHLHLPVLQYYNIPTLDYYGVLWDYLDSNGDGVSDEKDLAQWTTLWADYIHPNTAGHALAAATIVFYLETVKNNLPQLLTTLPEMPSQLLFSETQHYLTTEMYTKNNIGAKLTSFENVEYGFYGNKDANTIYNWQPWLIKSGGFLELKVNSLKGLTFMRVQGPGLVQRVNGIEDQSFNLSQDSRLTVTVNGKPVLKDSVSASGMVLNWASETYACNETGGVTIRLSCTEGIYCLNTILLAE